jgi:endonuclease/exonuclease/phosphatase family metal-dependent hydrolase
MKKTIIRTAAAAGFFLAAVFVYSEKTFTVLSYNVHNLFDAQKDGTEYPDYRAEAGKWTAAHYAKKLTNAAAAVRASGSVPEVILLQEIENEAVVKALAAELYSFGRVYAAAAPSNGGAVTTGLITVFPLKLIKSHGSQEFRKRYERLILEAELDIRGEYVTVFNNHWKSKAGANGEDEGLRLLSAWVLKKRIIEILTLYPDRLIIAAGDFNSEPDEYYIYGGIRAFMPESALQSAGSPPVKSLFLTSELKKAGVRNGELFLFPLWNLAPAGSGSYWYKSRWLRIDGMYAGSAAADGKGIELKSFGPVQNPLILTGGGKPLRWNSKNLTGFSDHLPVKAVFTY